MYKELIKNIKIPKKYKSTQKSKETCVFGVLVKRRFLHENIIYYKIKGTILLSHPPIFIADYERSSSKSKKTYKKQYF